MDCSYYVDDVCRSCTQLPVPYAQQLAAKDNQTQMQLASVAKAAVWLPPVASVPWGFRNKAKLVVGGVRGAVTFGILDAERRGVDVSECGLYEPVVAGCVRWLRGVVNRLGLVPYSVPDRTGELKHVVVTGSTSGHVAVRFIVRSMNQVGVLRRAVPQLLVDHPEVLVVSVNVQPEHKAVLDGREDDVVLTSQSVLPMVVDEVPLQLRARSFFQTNTAVAAELYRQATSWVAQSQAMRVWDVYCGVGGFGLHMAVHVGRPVAVTGIEVTVEAAQAAQASAAELMASGRVAGAVRFVAGDATEPGVLAGWGDVPDVLVVNPPRRGVGLELAQWIAASGVEQVIYSSCNPASLVKDVAQLGAYEVRQGRLFDMFPHTDHREVMLQLIRK